MTGLSGRARVEAIVDGRDDPQVGGRGGARVLGLDLVFFVLGIIRELENSVENGSPVGCLAHSWLLSDR